MKKRILIIMLAVCMLLSVAACGEKGGEDGGKNVVVSIFPLYDWTKAVLGGNPGNIEVKMLLTSGMDLHNFQPDSGDLADIENADLFLYIGGESDEWADEVLKTLPSGKLKTAAMMPVVDALEETELEGMQPNGEEEEEENASDEHIWLSLRNAKAMVQTVCDNLCAIDADNAELYRANASAYLTRLTELDGEYTEAISAAKYNTLLVADRFPFAYLVHDYSLNAYAAFSGCAAATDASFEVISFLADKLNELKLPAVLILEGSDSAIADTVLSESGADAEILTLNSCQCVTSENLNAGANYLDIMRANLEILEKALN